MRYSAEHKAETRKRLLDTSGAIAKKNGFSATGVDSLMEAAGLTSGAFYSHFSSKSELFTHLVENELESSVKMFADQSATLPNDQWIARQLKRYLNWKHRQSPETGCALPALAAEIARSDQATKEKYEAAVLQSHRIWAERLGNDEAAWAVISQLVGALLLSRAMASDATGKKVLDASRNFLQDTLGGHR